MKQDFQKNCHFKKGECFPKNKDTGIRETVGRRKQPYVGQKIKVIRKFRASNKKKVYKYKTIEMKINDSLKYMSANRYHVSILSLESRS